ncbi:MAG: hypothetical protein R3B90_03000 [Planctomycetaceae bacterium]
MSKRRSRWEDPIGGATLTPEDVEQLRREAREELNEEYDPDELDPEDRLPQPATPAQFSPDQ